MHVYMVVLFVIMDGHFELNWICACFTLLFIYICIGYQIIKKGLWSLLLI